MQPSVATGSKHILLISPYWKEEHRWMVSTVKMAELWQKMGHPVTVLCMGEKTETKNISPTLTIHTRKDFFLPDPWNYGIARGFSAAALKLAQEIHPDIIIVNKILFWSSFALLKLRKNGFKVVLITDALVGITWWPRGMVPRFGAFIYARTLGRKIMQAATRIVFFHPQPMHILKSLQVSEKSEVIPTGIDTTKYHPDQKHDGPVTVSYVGRLESVKGVDDFLVAAASLKHFMPEVQFQVVGWYKPNHPLVKRYQGSVTFTGLRHDIPEILSKTDIFVLPSYSEGLSNALMEAMASGCACIATRVGGNTFLLDDGNAGILFEPGNRPALIEQLRRLILDTDARTALSLLSKNRIEKMFDWRIVQDKYARLFDSVSS